jgi:hypothetical protein
MLSLKQIVHGAQYLFTCQKRELQHSYNKSKKILQELDCGPHDCVFFYGYKNTVTRHGNACTQEPKQGSFVPLLGSNTDHRRFNPHASKLV